ncbi:hypothetical protein G7046_g2393 [Stylonectria norvegica]|nr:hypothetical protein G7046_g2393 [Stylonectria norvegica]
MKLYGKFGPLAACMFVKQPLNSNAGVYMSPSKNLAPKYESFLEKAGFVDIIKNCFNWPLDHSPKDKYYEELGTWLVKTLNNSLASLFLALHTRFLGCNADEIRLFCSAGGQQLKDHTMHAYISIYIMCGKNPGADPVIKPES